MFEDESVTTETRHPVGRGDLVGYYVTDTLINFEYFSKG